eukprot:COSAG01_NODE_3393_length_6149_cov_24.742149_3_plen_110_part_00
MAHRPLQLGGGARFGAVAAAAAQRLRRRRRRPRAVVAHLPPFPPSIFLDENRRGIGQSQSIFISGNFIVGSDHDDKKTDTYGTDAQDELLHRDAAVAVAVEGGHQRPQL